jgi:shikimate kinase
MMPKGMNEERRATDPDRSASPPVVNLVLQGKGGVGKSLIASFLAQFYKARGHSVTCIDTDPVNQTFSQYAGIGAQHLKLMAGNQVDRRRFDDLIEEILATDECFVIDNGAATFIPLWHYMLENSVIRVLRDAKRRLLIHTVLTGGQALADTLAGFKSLAETCDSRNVIVWVNEYFGYVRRDGKDFAEMAVYREQQDKVAGVVIVHRRSPDTFGRDIEEMISRKLTFEETLQTGGLTLMSKQRLRMVRSETFEQLDELNILPQQTEERTGA